MRTHIPKGFSNSPFTQEEMKKASGYIEDALSKGAVGVSAGIMYLPECYNSTDDYANILAPMGKYQTPLCVHMRGKGDSMVDSVKEVIERRSHSENDQRASGIEKCFVNGKLAWKDGAMCDDTCGKNLRRTDI